MVLINSACRSNARPRLPAPLPEVQRFSNANYYSKLNPNGSDPEHRLGFITPSHDPKYAELNAKEFADFAQKRNGTLRIDEFGAADGAFAMFFLESLKALAPDVYARTSYHAWDNSSALQEPLASALSGHPNAKFGVADILSLGRQFPSNGSDYVFCHELFDDLASRVVSVREGALKEIWFAEKMVFPGMSAMQTEHRIIPVSTDYFNEIAVFMRTVPDKIRVTFPLDGINALGEVNGLLRSGGALRIFDYGFANVDELVFINRAYAQGTCAGRVDALVAGFSIVGSSLNVQGTLHASKGDPDKIQMTTPVNFPFLENLLKSMKFSTLLETHFGWASRIAGEQMITPAHCAQGLAHSPELFKSGEQLPRAAAMLLSAHRAFTDESLKFIQSIVSTLGETEAALNIVLEKLEDALPDRIMAFRVQLGEPGFVANTLVSSVATELMKEGGAYSRIERKAREVNQGKNFTDLIPESTETSFRNSFSTEIEELVRAGFDRKELLWKLFTTPPDSQYSGSSSRHSLTAVKNE